MNKWAIVFGGSTGIGFACVKELINKNYNTFIVHRDGKILTKEFYDNINDLKKNKNNEIKTLNTNIFTEEGRKEVIEFLDTLPKKSVKVYLHSIASGSIGYLFSEKKLSYTDLLNTIEMMGTNFYYWAHEIFERDLFMEGAHIMAFTSEGSRRVLKGYAAVGAAKAVLETLCRYMAVELAKNKIFVNLLCPGVTNTKAIKVFPEVEKLIEQVNSKNPFERLTTPEDVAKLFITIIESDINWLSGEVIHIDGGEQNVF